MLTFRSARQQLLRRSGTDAAGLALAGAAFLSTTSFGLTVPVLPIFLRQIGASDAAQTGMWAGLAIGISPLFSALALPVWGVLGDRHGHKLMMQRALTCMALALFLLALATHPLQVVVLRALGGAFGGMGAAVTAAASVSIARERLGHAIGTIQAAQTMGLLVGPIVGGVLSDLFGPRTSFATGAACLLAGLAGVSRGYADPSRPAPNPDAPFRTAARMWDMRAEAGALRPLWIILPSLFAMQFVDGGYTVLLPFHLERLGAPPHILARLVGGTLSITAIAMAVATVAIGRAAVPERIAGLLRTLLAAGAGLSLLAMAAGAWWVFAASRVAVGFALGAVPTLVYVATAASSPPERQGMLLGTVTGIGLIAWASSPLFTGAMTSTNPRWVLGLYVVLCGGAALVLARGRLPALRRGGASVIEAPGVPHASGVVEKEPH